MLRIGARSARPADYRCQRAQGRAGQRHHASSIAPKANTDILNVLEVDIGIRSILRRLLQGWVPPRWIRRLQQPVPPNSIRWEFANIVEADPQRRLRLNISHERLANIHPGRPGRHRRRAQPGGARSHLREPGQRSGRRRPHRGRPEDAGADPGIAGAGEGGRHHRGDGARRGCRRAGRNGRGGFRRNPGRDGVDRKERCPRAAGISRRTPPAA